MAIKPPQKIYSSAPGPILNVARWMQTQAYLDASKWSLNELPNGSAVESKPTKPIPLTDRTKLDADAVAVVTAPGRISDLIALRISSDLMAAAERAIRLRSMSPARRRYQAAYRRMTIAADSGPVEGLIRYVNVTVSPLV